MITALCAASEMRKIRITVCLRAESVGCSVSVLPLEGRSESAAWILYLAELIIIYVLLEPRQEMKTTEHMGKVINGMSRTKQQVLIMAYRLLEVSILQRNGITRA